MSFLPELLYDLPHREDLVLQKAPGGDTVDRHFLNIYSNQTVEVPSAVRVG